MEFNLTKLAKRKELEAKSFPDGGLNTSLAQNKIGDDESAQMLNFRYKNGSLTLRQGLQKIISLDYGKIIDIYPKNGKSIVLSRIYPINNIAVERRGIYIATEKAILYYDGTNVNQVCKLTVTNDKTEKTIEELSLSSGTLIPTGGAKTETFALNNVTYTIQGENILFIGSGKFLIISPKRDTTDTEKVSVIPTISEAEPYVPLLFEQCTSNGEGKRVGAHNILTDKVKQFFTTDGKSKVYYLCDNHLTDGLVTVNYRVKSGMEYQALLKESYITSLDENLTVSIDRRAGYLEFSSPLCDAKADGLINNLQVFYEKASPLKENLLNCSVGEWFNGGSKSSSGNGRLFVSGNDRDPNRIFCSSQNDPTYFPDDIYFFVGRPNEKVTALKTIANYMIIFMENSIFSLNYVQFSNTADFIIKEISSVIGCDVPKTIARIANLLVFAASGKVYSLNPSQINSCKSLNVISEKISEELSKVSVEDYSEASAAFDGKDYLLFFGTNVFALATTKKDCNIYEGKVAWFLYKLPFALKNSFATTSGIAVFSEDEKEIYKFSENATDDCGKLFDAFIFSKNYDFDISYFYKRLTLAQVAAKGEDGAEFDFVINFDGKEKSTTIKIDNTDGYEKNYSVVPLYNRVNSVKVGVRRKKDCNKKFSIDGFSLKALKTSPKR